MVGHQHHHHHQQRLSMTMSARGGSWVARCFAACRQRTAMQRCKRMRIETKTVSFSPVAAKSLRRNASVTPSLPRSLRLCAHPHCCLLLAACFATHLSSHGVRAGNGMASRPAVQLDNVPLFCRSTKTRVAAQMGRLSISYMHHLQQQWQR